ncbi:LamG-like jellyroll fold domain-containing protein [Gelidibacter salicanalis]|uniref:LamG-like jellyroll fold domain-containing protein n=1 Tax=Gelidibacter salicanalis TaxID=291193 RepID=UPI001B8805B9|nr:LamG-like jellyroll fold domain-containing protein [Gelidibacter salicanalis]
MNAVQDVNLDASCEITVPDVRGFATDNCMFTITQSPAIGSKVALAHNGTTTVTVTAKDAAGNTDIKVVTLTAKDVTQPVLTVNAVQNVNLDASCEITVPDVRGSATDNCMFTITQSPSIGSKVALAHNGTTTVTVTAKDAAGNTDIKIVTLTAKDVTKPVLTVGGTQNVNLDASCGITVPDVRGSATDNCTFTITQSPAIGSKVALAHNGTTTVTVTAKDAAGNTDIKVVTLTAKDVTQPVLTVNAVQDVNLDASCEITVPDVRGSAMDNCMFTITQSPAIGSKVALAHNGKITVTVTAKDAAGNTDIKIVTLTAKDVTKPILTVGGTQNVNLDASCEITVPDVRGSATDNCTVSITQSPAIGSKVALAHNGTTAVTVTANDAAGNTDTKIVTLTAIDNTLPTLNVGENLTANTNAATCDASVNVPNVIYDDNCQSSVSISFTLSGATTLDPTTGQVGVRLFNKGITAIEYTVTDGANLTVKRSRTVTIVDSTPPTLTPGHNLTVNTSSTTCDASVTVPDAVLSDNCSASVSYTLTGATVLDTTLGQVGTRTFNKGVTTISYTVTDGVNPVVTKSKTVTVVDNTAPTLTAGSNIIANTTSTTCDALIQVSDAVFGDNCSSAVSLSFTLTGDTTLASTAGQVGSRRFNKGVTIINYTVTDGVNMVTHSKTVTINDKEDPVTPTLVDLTAECSLTVIPPTTTDNCDGVNGVIGTTSLTDLTFDTIGEHLIYWVFTDASGNSTDPVIQKVIITDTKAPVIDASLTNYTHTINGCEIASVSDLNHVPTAEDECDGTIVGVLSNIVFPYVQPGINEIEWTFTDDEGNFSTQKQYIELIPPVINGGTITGIYNGKSSSDEISIASCGGDINIPLSLDEEIGEIVQWEKYEVGDEVNWVIIANLTNSYNAFFKDKEMVSTYFRVLVKVGDCYEYSDDIFVKTERVGSVPELDPDNFEICLSGSVTLTLKATGYYEVAQDPIVSSGGDFQSGQLFNDGWIIDGITDKNEYTSSTNNGKPANWGGSTGAKPYGKVYKINYNSGDPKFAIAQGNYSSKWIKDFYPWIYAESKETTLETPSIALEDLISGVLNFDQAFNLERDDYIKLELILKNATGPLTTINLTGDASSAKITGPITYNGDGSQNTSPLQQVNADYNFGNDNTSYNILDLIKANYSDLSGMYASVRFTFHGTTDESAWAIDNISLATTSKKIAEIEWTDGVGNPAGEVLSDEETFTFTPIAPGHYQYGATSIVGGCRTYDGSETALADVFVYNANAGVDAIFTDAECGPKSVQLNAFDNRISSSANNDKFAALYPLSTNPRPYPESDQDGAMTKVDANGVVTAVDWILNDNGTTTKKGGMWSFSRVDTGDSDCGQGEISDPYDPNAIFTGGVGKYTLTWSVGTLLKNGADVTIENVLCSDDITIIITPCEKIDFDGNDNYVDFGEESYSLKDDFSLEVWVKPESINGTQTIFSKREVNSVINSFGYDLSIDNAGFVSFNFNVNGSISSSPYKIDNTRWYHIAITHSSSGRYRLYVDGVLVVPNGSGGSPNYPTDGTKYKAILGAMGKKNSSNPINNFKGWMDEVRIWNVELTKEQIRQMMNQRIISSPTVSGNVQGEIIPVDVSGVSWSNLIGYYQMNFDDCGNFKSTAGISGELKNMDSAQDKTAPLPYSSYKDGLWGTNTTWKYLGTGKADNWNSNLWLPPNSKGINGTPIDWNIVRVINKISASRDVTLLGLIIDDGGKLTMEGITAAAGTGTGQGLWITHYLELDGVIDLEGESQLVQKRYTPSQINESIFEPASSGFIERDQQGTANFFNYNYWSSPVVSGGSEASNFTISSVLHDGTNSSNPSEIKWIKSYDGQPGIPLKLSNRWLTTYTNKLSNTYASWDRINENSLINIGLGYTMKGSGANTPTQNYVFIGRPNNGTISTNISKGNDALVGNPYPSAIDADAFIDDNESSLEEGSLQFWEHFDSNNTHVLRAYKGGYATYNKTGGQVAVSPKSTTDSVVIVGGQGTRKPGRFIPVGQGFFVTAGTKGGDVTFKNSQRIFKREAENSSEFFRAGKGTKYVQSRTSDTKKMEIQRIRLNFITPEGTVRPLLLGFTPNNLATDGVDYGYDALNKDNYPSDLSWMINDSKYIIQGVGSFIETKKYPFALHMGQNGTAEIKLTELENFSEEIEVYIYDSVLGTYHAINDSSFALSLDTGNYDNRFYLAFSEDNTLSLADEDLKIAIVKYLQQTDEIYIKTPAAITVQKVSLINIIGQTVQAWDASNTTLSNDMKIPVKNLPDGSYIVKIQTTTGTLNKKLIIKY